MQLLKNGFHYSHACIHSYLNRNDHHTFFKCWINVRVVIWVFLWNWDQWLYLFLLYRHIQLVIHFNLKLILLIPLTEPVSLALWSKVYRLHEQSKNDNSWMTFFFYYTFFKRILTWKCMLHLEGTCPMG